eukprot:scaffold80713_cov42-Prasinocladus_malaysianus.AAC.2
MASVHSRRRGRLRRSRMRAVLGCEGMVFVVVQARRRHIAIPILFVHVLVANEALEFMLLSIPWPLVVAGQTSFPILSARKDRVCLITTLPCNW